MSSAQQCDIAVVGAGIVGLSACFLLAKQGYRSTLIDPTMAAPPLPRPYDLKTYALTPASMRVFERLGVAAALESERIAEFSGMKVWDANSNGVIEFDAPALGRQCLGYIIEHANLIRALHNGLARCDVRQITARVESVECHEQHLQLRLNTGALVQASLVLACDGAHSQMRQMLGVKSKTRPYSQHAVVCNVETEYGHGQIARQRFLASGPLAFLPLAQQHSCAIVWSTTPQQAAFAASASDDVFRAMLSQAFDHAVGEVQTTSERIVVPLQKLHIGRYVVGRSVLLGDAAHVVHPLAGQGLNLGIMDVAALVECLDSRDELTLKFPRAALRRFERMRRGENLAMLNLTDQLNRLFGNDHGAMKKIRSAGMTAFNRSVPLKHWLMLRAMGDLGDVPKIAAIR